MATYTNRTCTNCGIRKPQPQMVSKEIYVETGKSKAGVSGATFLGSGFGDKKSQRAVNSWLFNSGQRTYKRKKTVWMCPPCAKTTKVSSDDNELGNVAKIILGIIIVIAIIIADDSSTGSSSSSSSYSSSNR